MNLINTILILTISEGIFNTDVYYLKNILGIAINMLVNILIFGFGIFFFLKTSNKNFIKINYIIFIAISLISMIINQSSLLDSFEFILRYGRIYLILFIGYHMSDSFSEEKIFKTLSLVNIANFITNSLWYFNIQIIPNKYFGTLDFATGIMSDALYQSFFSVIVLGLSLLLLNQSNSYSKKLLFFNILSAIIQIFWSYSYHFYVVLFISFVVSLLILQSVMNFFKIIIPILIAIIVMNSLSTSEFFTNSFITLANTSPKIASYRDTFSDEYQKNYQQIIGVGPGNGGSYIGIENKSIVAENYFSIYDYFTEKLRHGSITTLPNTGIITLKSELGYLGLIHFIFLLSILISSLNTSRFSLINKNLKNLCIFLIIIFFVENLFADYLQHSLFPVITFLLVGMSIDRK